MHMHTHTRTRKNGIFPANYHKISREVIGYKRIVLKAIYILSFRDE